MRPMLLYGMVAVYRAIEKAFGKPNVSTPPAPPTESE
jgi:hypothetical protein